jgi:hypothetical protein
MAPSCTAAGTGQLPALQLFDQVVNRSSALSAQVADKLGALQLELTKAAGLGSAQALDRLLRNVTQVGRPVVLRLFAVIESAAVQHGSCCPAGCLYGPGCMAASWGDKMRYGCCLHNVMVSINLAFPAAALPP